MIFMGNSNLFKLFPVSPQGLCTILEWAGTPQSLYECVSIFVYSSSIQEALPENLHVMVPKF